MALIWQQRPILLGSQSPRRAQLLGDLGLQFRQIKANMSEDYPAQLKAGQIAEFLAESKADFLAEERRLDELLICSDTVVWSKGQSLEKAANRTEALAMLAQLSGDTHEVITGVCLIGEEGKTVFSDRCKVRFRTLSQEEMVYYVDHYQPFDKAGAYGIQEWIGLAAIEAIEGSYFTVMGLPTEKIVSYLRNHS
jgi:septum formation protein